MPPMSLVYFLQKKLPKLKKNLGVLKTEILVILKPQSLYSNRNFCENCYKIVKNRPICIKLYRICKELQEFTVFSLQSFVGNSHGKISGADIISTFLYFKCKNTSTSFIVTFTLLGEQNPTQESVSTSTIKRYVRK